MIHMNLNPVDFSNYKPIFTQKGFKEISLKDEKYSLLAEVIDSIKVINDFKEEGTLEVLAADFEVPGTRIYDNEKNYVYTCQSQEVFLVYGINNIDTLDTIGEFLEHTQYIGGSIYLDPLKPSAKIIYMDNIKKIIDSLVMNHTHLGVAINKEYFENSLNVTKQSRLKCIMTNILSTISDLLYLENKSDSAKFFVDRNSSLFEFSIDIDGLPVDEECDMSNPVFGGSLTLFSSQLLFMGSTIEMMSTILGISEKQALQMAISILCDSLSLVNTNIGTIPFNKFALPITKLMEFHLDELKNVSSLAIREMKIARTFHNLFKEFNTPVETKGNNVVPLF